MSKRPALTLAFLAHAPEAAADVLERLGPEEAAVFLADIPARLAAPVIRRMTSWSGARCIEQLEATRAAAILQRLPFHDGAGLMRLLAADCRTTVTAELPARLAQRLRRVFRYSAGSVGAWIDPDVPSFSTEVTVKDALRYLKHNEGVSHIFVHSGNDSRFKGAIPIGRVLRSPASARLSEIGSEDVAPLSSRASLSSALAHGDWGEYLVLPVTGRQRTLVGGLSRSSLNRGLAERGSAQRARPGSVMMQLLAALGIASSGLVRVLFSSLADDPPGVRRGHDNG